MKDFIKQLESALSPIKEAWHDEYFDILEKPWSDAVDYDKTIEKQPEKVNRYIPGSPEKDFAQCSDKDKAGEFQRAIDTLLFGQDEDDRKEFNNYVDMFKRTHSYPAFVKYANSVGIATEDLVPEKMGLIESLTLSTPKLQQLMSKYYKAAEQFEKGEITFEEYDAILNEYKDAYNKVVYGVNKNDYCESTKSIQALIDGLNEELEVGDKVQIKNDKDGFKKGEVTHKIPGNFYQVKTEKRDELDVKDGIWTYDGADLKKVSENAQYLCNVKQPTRGRFVTSCDVFTDDNLDAGLYEVKFLANNDEGVQMPIYIAKGIINSDGEWIIEPTILDHVRELKQQDISKYITKKWFEYIDDTIRFPEMAQAIANAVSTNSIAESLTSLLEMKEITKEQWNKTPKDYKMIKNGQKYIMYLDKSGTVLAPCKIVDESLDYTEPGNTFQVCIQDGDDENSEPECVSIEDTLEDAIERAKYEYSHSDLDENTVVTVIWVENGETLFYIDKDCEEKLKETYDASAISSVKNLGPITEPKNETLQLANKLNSFSEGILYGMPKSTRDEIIKVVNDAIVSGKIRDRLDNPDMYCDLISEKVGLDLAPDEWIAFAKNNGERLLMPRQPKDESLDEEYPPTSFQFDVKVDSLEELNDDELIFDLLTDLISYKYGYHHHGYYAEVAERDEENLIAKCEVSDVKWDLDESLNEEDDKFNYMMLDRLRTDCEYFLDNGNGCEKHLWAGNVEAQIKKMRDIYSKLPEKPEWLSLEDIDKYEEEMLAKKASKNESLSEAKAEAETLKIDYKEIKNTGLGREIEARDKHIDKYVYATKDEGKMYIGTKPYGKLISINIKNGKPEGKFDAKAEQEIYNKLK